MTPPSNTIIKFAAYTIVVGLIIHNDKTAYWHEVNHLTEWCRDNLVLNTSKIKEVVIDIGEQRDITPPPSTHMGKQWNMWRA